MPRPRDGEEQMTEVTVWRPMHLKYNAYLMIVESNRKTAITNSSSSRIHTSDSTQPHVSLHRHGTDNTSEQ